MKFETLQNAKFKPLSNSEMLVVRGGEDTGGGSKVIWQGEVLVACDGQNGGVEYRHVMMSKLHVWSSDSITDGRTCLWGEGYAWVEA